MINVHELRVGNYVLVNNKVRKICLITNEEGLGPSVGYNGEKEGTCAMCSVEKLEPVPITDQLLKDLGFTFHDHYKLWQHTRPENSYSIELDRDYTPFDFAHRPITRNMKHLHQLQNLFYSIQQEELNEGKLRAVKTVLSLA